MPRYVNLLTNYGQVDILWYDMLPLIRNYGVQRN